MNQYLLYLNTGFDFSSGGLVGVARFAYHLRLSLCLICLDFINVLTAFHAFQDLDPSPLLGWAPFSMDG